MVELSSLVIAAVTLAILPLGKWLFSHGEAIFLCVTDLPKGKLPLRNFHGYVKKNKRIAHDSSKFKSYG